MDSLTMHEMTELDAAELIAVNGGETVHAEDAIGWILDQLHRVVEWVPEFAPNPGSQTPDLQTVMM